jgi:lipoprotein-releasing system permease protein
MRYELFIGLRYLRAKRREAFISLITLISTLGLAIGVMTLDITLSVMTGFEEDLRDRILGFNPHVSVWSYLGPMEDSAAWRKRCAPFPASPAPSRSSTVQLMLTTPSISRACSCAASSRARPPIRPRAAAARRQHRPAAAGLRRALADGRGATVQLPGIIVAASSAGSSACMSGTRQRRRGGAGSSGVPHIRSFVVVGEFDSGMPDYDAGLAYVSLSDAQRLYDMGDAVTGIEAKVTDLYQADAVGAAVSQALGTGYRVRDWMEANRNLFPP